MKRIITVFNYLAACSLVRMCASKTFLPHSKVIEYALTFVCLYIIMSLRRTWNTITIFIFMKSEMTITSLICTIVDLILFASCTLSILFYCTFIANTFFKTIIKWFILFTEYALIFKFYSSRKAFTSFNVSSVYKYFIFSTWSWIVNTNSIFDIIWIETSTIPIFIFLKVFITNTDSIRWHYSSILANNAIFNRFSITWFAGIVARLTITIFIHSIIIISILRTDTSVILI